MLIPLLLGSLILTGNMIIQIVLMLYLIRLLLNRMGEFESREGFGFQTRTMIVVVLALFLGHVVQFAIWAGLFVYLGEFDNFATAFYFSAVNFTSLGYGDIVMSDHWRLLGPLETANGVLMFGLSAGAILSVMGRMLNRYFPTGFHSSNGGNK